MTYTLREDFPAWTFCTSGKHGHGWRNDVTGLLEPFTAHYVSRVPFQIRCVECHVRESQPEIPLAKPTPIHELHYERDARYEGDTVRNVGAYGGARADK